MKTCKARCPNGTYIGYACCSEENHDGDHTITRGKAEPPHYEVVHTWSDPKRYYGAGATAKALITKMEKKNG
jgi:hypothetical protein